MKSSRQLRGSRRGLSRQSDAIRKGYVFDYGARRSIREAACGRRRQHYFLARDEVMYMLLAEKTLTRAVRTFLTDHGVDLGEFNEQIKVILITASTSSTWRTVTESSSGTSRQPP